MSKEMKDPAAAAKSRQRGLTVLERQAEAERIEAEKEAARRPRQAAKRSQSLPRTRPVADKEKTSMAASRLAGAVGNASTSLACARMAVPMCCSCSSAANRSCRRRNGGAAWW